MTVAPLFRGADGPNCKDIINGIAFSMPSYLCHGHCNFSSYYYYIIQYDKQIIIIIIVI